MRKQLRYADLLALGIVNNRVSLSNWIHGQGFPPGRLIGPNSRAWDESEVQRWLDSRPVTAKKPTPSVKGRRGRPRKAERQAHAE
jgi:hypothetical protein